MPGAQRSIPNPLDDPPALELDEHGPVHAPELHRALPLRSCGRLSRSPLVQTSTVTRRKVAGIDVASLFGLWFWLSNRSPSSFWRSAARPFFSAASKAFIVGP